MKSPLKSPLKVFLVLLTLASISLLFVKFNDFQSWKQKPKMSSSRESDVLKMNIPDMNIPVPKMKIPVSTVSTAIFINSSSMPNTTESDAAPVVRTFVLREAYFDERQMNGHKNRIFILAEAKKGLHYIGCGINGVASKTFQVVNLYNNWILGTHPHLTHGEIGISCYDVDMQENNEAFISFHPTKSSTEIVTRTIKVNKVRRRNESESKGEIVACLKCHHRPPWLKQWLMYQKTLGVDLVQMYVEDTFMSHPENLEIIENFVRENFVNVVQRKAFFNETQLFIGDSQLLNFNDCLYRHRGVYEFAFFLDTDDFFIPRLPNKTAIFYLERYFKDQNQAEVRFTWYRHYPDCGLTMPLSNLTNGNVTEILAYQENFSTGNTKFVCRPELTTLVSVHGSVKLIRGSRTRNGYVNEAYVAHVRQNRLWEIPNKAKCEDLARKSYVVY